MEPIYQDNIKQIEQIGCRYRYQTDSAKHVDFRVRARHITEDQLIIPTLPTEDLKKNDPDVPGWACGEKAMTLKPL